MKDQRFLFATLGVGLATFAVAIVFGLSDRWSDEARAAQDVVSGPTVFEVSVGADSDVRREFVSYFPRRLEVNAGDVVTFRNVTRDIPHTVTFGVATPADQVPFLTSAGEERAIAVAPCVSPTAPSAMDEACRGDTSGTDLVLTGGGYLSTGVIPAGEVVPVEIGADITPGTYSYFCLVHPGQRGELEVLPADDPAQSPTAAAERARSDLADDSQILDRAEIEAGGPGRSDGVVRAGVATDSTSLNVFVPERIEVPVGTTVTWENTSGTPHIVAMNDGRTSPVIGRQPYGTTVATHRFDQPGSYFYFCPIHPGMAGEVVVVDSERG